MKMMDCVEVIVEKDKYVKDGVHKGMQGWICLEDNSNGTWLVNFPQYGEKDDIAEISIMLPPCLCMVHTTLKIQHP